MQNISQCKAARIFSILLLAVCFAPIAGMAQSTDMPLLPLKIDVGQKAPDFSVQSPEGKTISLSDFSGHNVLIDFYRGYW